MVLKFHLKLLFLCFIILRLNEISILDGFSHHLYSDGSYDYPDGMISGMEDYKSDYGDYYGKPMRADEIEAMMPLLTGGGKIHDIRDYR